MVALYLLGISQIAGTGQLSFGGAPTASGTTGGALFGAASSASSTAAPGGLFGSKPTTTASGGLFGSASSTAAPAVGGALFGASTASTGAGLFGAASSTTTATSSAGGGLFGAPSSTAEGVSFGMLICSRFLSPFYSFACRELFVSNFNCINTVLFFIRKRSQTYNRRIFIWKCWSSCSFSGSDIQHRWVSQFFGLSESVCLKTYLSQIAVQWPEQKCS